MVIVFLYLEKIQDYFQRFSYNYQDILQDRIEIDNIASIEKDFKKKMAVKKAIYISRYQKTSRQTSQYQ